MKIGTNRTERGTAGGARRAARMAIAAGVLAIAGTAIATPAFAATITASNHPSPVTIVQGASDELNWTVRNNGTTIPVAASGSSITFRAPTGSTFPLQYTVPAYSSSDGVNFVPLSNLTVGICLPGNGGATLTCNITASNNLNWVAANYIRMTPLVEISPTAAAGSFSATADLTLRDRNGGTNTYNNGTLDLVTPTVVATPIVSVAAAGVVGATALTVGGVFLYRRKRKGVVTAS